MAQNATWRVRLIAVVLLPMRSRSALSATLLASVGRAVRAHVAHPFSQIGGDRKQRQGGDQGGGRGEQQPDLEIKAQRGQDQSRERDLRGGIKLGNQERLDGDRLADKPR